MVRVTQRMKSMAERTLGLHISRALPAPVTKHADPAIAQLRRWSPRDVVFDVGANDGRTVLRLNGPLGAPRFFAFEPVAETHRILAARTAHLPNVRTFPLALGAACGRQEIHLDPMSSMSSFRPDWSSGSSGRETVPVSTVDEVMVQEDVDFVHLLKIDTEGYEMEVLKGAERALRESRVVVVQLEVGLDQMPKQFLSLDDARRYLAERGYRLQGIYNQCLTPAKPPVGWSQEMLTGYRPDVLAYVDALFIRADL
jgi:FkbM family methyltransferase